MLLDGGRGELEIEVGWEASTRGRGREKGTGGGERGCGRGGARRL